VPTRKQDKIRQTVGIGLAFCCLVVGCAGTSTAERETLAVSGIPVVVPAAAQVTSLPEPTPPDDLWVRLRRDLALAGRDLERVETQRSWFTSHPDYLDRISERAAPYLYHIVEEVQRRGMPAEIALLPAVESAFQPFAYSHGRAAGMWQFIPSTARYYGLRLSWWYDGRRDIIASTRAALEHLSRLHKTFDGDWLLALAAYNSGQGTVRAAMRRNARNGKPTDFWSLHLPKETEQYVPRLLALAAIVAAPERFGIELPRIANDRYLRVVDIDSQIDLALAARLAGLDLDEVYRLNPGFNRWATDPEGPHYLVLPLAQADRFEEQLAELPLSERVQWRRHRIGNGETLSDIAVRYQTTVDVLREVNQLEGSVIRAGHHLIVPVATRDLSEYTLTASARLDALQSRPRGDKKVTHRVRPGDSLWSLARSYGVKVSSLAAWNGMAPGDILRQGQKLVIWQRQKAKTATLFNAPSRRAVERKIYYVVRRGDSLARISQRFNVTVRQLVQWNGLDRGAYLQPGQNLTLYVDVTRLSESG
jgi:membrane-bound lytic murein transglycosylase D